MGMLYYVTTSPPVEGVIVRQRCEDFIVIEDLDTKTQRNGKYALYRVVKRDVSTHEAARLIARVLGCPYDEVKYAGLKDTKAVCVQHFTVPKRLARSLPRRFVAQGVSALLLGFTDDPLASTHIAANTFIVRFRGKRVCLDAVERALEMLREKPLLPAYYGHQRFGTRRPLSHIVGKFIVQRRFCEAIEVLRTQTFRSEAPQEQMLRLKGSCRRGYEAHLDPRRPLDSIKKALGASLVKILVHAFQAYLFNLILSLILEEHGDLSSLANEYPMLPVPGWRVKADGKARSILGYVMEEEGVSEDYFKLPELGLTFPGSYRPSTMAVKGLTWWKKPDELIVKFKLGRGCYATIVLRELLKSDPTLF